MNSEEVYFTKYSKPGSQSKVAEAGSYGLKALFRQIKIGDSTTLSSRQTMV